MPRSARSRETYGKLLMIAVVFVVVPWLMFLYEASTGLTVASKYRLGENSTPQHLASTRRLAIGVSCFFVPVAVLLYAMWRERAPTEPDPPPPSRPS